MSGCRRARRAILSESDEVLAVDAAFALEEHLARCPRCRRFRDVELTIREGLVDSAEPQLAPAAVEDAVAAVQAALRDTPAAPALRSRRWPRVAAAAGVVVALAAGAAHVLRTERGEAVPRVARVAPAEPPAELAAESVVSQADVPTDPDAVRTLLREELLASFAGRAPGADAAEALAGFEQALLPLGDRWPLVRFVEELVADEEPAVARAAVCVLGHHGDRISASVLRLGLARAEVGPDAVRALGELGHDGLPGLAEALELEPLTELALETLAAVGGQGAAQVVERSLLARGADLERDAAHLDALTAMGPVALAPLLRLAGRGEEARRACLGRIEFLPGAGDALVPLLDDGETIRPDLLFEAALRLPSPAALAWVEAQCLDRARRARALETLARWEGVEPLEAVLRLAAAGRLGDEEILEVTRTLVTSDPRRAADLAREVARAAPDVARGLLELLVASGVEGTGGACAVLAGAALHEDERLWAALAAGDLGEPADADLLADVLARTDPGERRLRAAILLSIHRLGGEPAVVRALGLSRGQAWERLRRALAEADERGAAVALHRVVRALDEVHERSENPWEST